MNKPKRVVVTGLGVISSIGIGWEEFWKNLVAGKSGISRISSFDTSSYDRHFAGEVKDFHAREFIKNNKIKNLGRASQMAIAACKLALKDGASSDYTSTKFKDRIGISVGITMGESQVVENITKKILNKKTMENILVLSCPANTIPVNVATELKLTGYNLVFSTACSAGNYSIAYAFDLIKRGKTNYMLAGGVDALSRIAFTGFSRLLDMAQEKCQPFDKNRTGMMIGEGSAVLLLEGLDNALKRKAHIYAEILGYGLSCDAHDMTYPSVGGIVKAISRALNESQVKESEIDYISAHGTGTKENDKAECQAYKRVFGKLSTKIPISSIKSMLGHTMGAASAFESIACCLTVDKNEIPPTINFEEKDPECDIDCVPNKGRPHRVKVALNNSQAFGGNNGCLVFKGYT